MTWYRVEPWLIYSALTLVMLVGIALPVIGWLTLVPLAATGMNDYANTRRLQAWRVYEETIKAAELACERSRREDLGALAR